MATDTPRIYVACLGDYNSGHLHGVWIDLTEGITADDVHAQIQAMLRTSVSAFFGDAEEWAIHDDEGFGDIDIHESDSVEKVVRIAELIHEHDDVFLAWISAHSTETGFDINSFDPDAHAGTYASEKEWAEADTEEQDEKLKELFGNCHCWHFDHESYVLAARTDGTEFVDYGGRVYVFQPQ